MPEAHLLILSLLVPLAGAVLSVLGRGRARWISLATSAATLMVTSAVLHAAYTQGPQIYRLGGWAPPYGIVLVADLFSALMAATAALLATFVALHALLSRREPLDQALYHSLFLLLLMALCGVFYTGDLFTMYVFMELVILSSFALVAMADRPVSPEATFKYAVLSALGSTLLLFGVALVYAGVGTLNMADIAQRVLQDEPPPFWGATATLLLFVFLLKGAIFPFHFWQPDAHSAAPAPVSAMLSGIMVKIGFYGIVRMQTLLFQGAPVLEILAPLGAATAVFGAFAAVANRDLKRMLAYSTISNMGFILLALGWGGAAGLFAAIINAVNHALIKGGLFLTGGHIVERLDEHEMPRMGGMVQLTPGGAVAFGIGGLAIAGFPPLNGFLSKLTLFQAGIAAGSAWLLGAALLASALALVYPLRAFVRVFWGDTPARAVQRWSEGESYPGAMLAPLLLVLLYVAIGIWPEPLMALARAATEELQAPDIYISAVLGGAR
ncbi:proton-conducting transporter membrane subunit [soil metagenome]